MILCARIHPGESVLIHSGSGATGLAAISVALSKGCEVFTTVSTKEKKQFLMSMFPQLKEENFGMYLQTIFDIIFCTATNFQEIQEVNHLKR